MLRILKNKKGEVMPLAIATMVVVFLLCMLLTSFAVAGKLRTVSRGNSGEERIALNQIGEDFLAWYQRSGSGESAETSAFTSTNEKYVARTENVVQEETGESGVLLTVYRADDEEKRIRLTVSIEGGTVVRWAYGS